MELTVALIFTEIFLFFLESVRTPTTVSDTKETKPTEVTRNTNSRTESSILEELPSIEKTISEEFREDSEKPRSEYENCSFESDATSPSRPSSVPQASSHNGEIQIEEEPSSLTGENHILFLRRNMFSLERFLSF